jgi:type I restriction enzyme R subunit
MSTTPCEYTLVEKPLIDLLTTEYGPSDGQPGYVYIPPAQHTKYRGTRENEVLFTPLLVQALVRINNIPESSAQIFAAELQSLTDNERWLDILRGNYSKKISGEDTYRTIKVVDFDNPANNHFAVTNQLFITGGKNSIPDLIIYLNGIPVVVIEAKSPISTSQNTWTAVSQIQQYEENIPRLFHSNLFNIATNNLTFLYGATGSPRQHWNRWRDPWPRTEDEFQDEAEKGVYSLLAPDRLLDILAHFIIFETRDGKTIKKICRYQQFRAVNKMVERVVSHEARQGLIWHTQGSGKSLTMVFAALKLKFHRGITSERLQNPNLMVITDRKDLHNQISQTFMSCGLPNPQNADSIARLREMVKPGSVGLTVMSTIFKFQWSSDGLKSPDMKVRQKALAQLEIPGSENWILMVDEAHRTQEKDLGSYLRAVLPHAIRFGFTGTPVKKGDKDTFQNFGASGEAYLDKYGIQDAVDDGATVPVYYQGRMTEWHLEGAELDVLFDQYFANEPEELVDEIKRKGVTKGHLARYQPRIKLIAADIWAHYSQHVLPDGFKAQIVAIDRPACVVYKKELDKAVTNYLVSVKDLPPKEARQRAEEMSVCIYSPGQHDQKEKPELVEYQLDETQEKQAIENFKNPDHPLRFLIVCNKLLTGFDAPVEQAMYLDNPLSDHNLLQAIARTNRRYTDKKDRGSIVDYIGVSKNLAEALAAYNDDDVKGALRNEDELLSILQSAHRLVMNYFQGFKRTDDPKTDIREALNLFKSEDTWFDFSAAAKAFLSAYTNLSPDPRVLVFKTDFKFIAALHILGKREFENSTDELDWRQYSAKVREILKQHLKVTGLDTVIKLRALIDPSFWEEFKNPGEDLQTAAVRKTVELKKETAKRTAENPARYAKFSERVQELIEKFQQGLLDAATVLDKAKEIADDVLTEDAASESSGLSVKAYNVLKILERFVPEKPASDKVAEGQGAGADNGGASKTSEVSPFQQAALDIDELYRTDEWASSYWQEKTQARKKLRQKVRRIVHSLVVDSKEVSNVIDAYAVRHYAKP